MAWDSTISPRDALPPTPPGWPSRSWPTTWPAGPDPSLWMSRWQPPRPCGGASSPWPDASPARRGASPCICHGAGPGRTSSTAPWPGCGHCHSLPDGGVAVWPVPKATQPPGRPAPVKPRISPAANWPPVSSSLVLRAARNPLPLIAAPGNRPYLPASSPTISFPPFLPPVSPSRSHPFGGLGLRLLLALCPPVFAGEQYMG